MPLPTVPAPEHCRPSLPVSAACRLQAHDGRRPWRHGPVFPIKDDNPTRDFPFVTVSLIVLNVVIFFAQQLLGDRFTYNFAMIPGIVTHHPWEANEFVVARGLVV